MFTIPHTFKYVYISSNRLNSIKSLARMLEVSDPELHQTANLIYKYKSKIIPKKNGTTRKIHKPAPNIRKIQSLINSRLIKPNIKWPSYIYGCIPNTFDSNTKSTIRKDYVACATKHCRSKSILHLDISDFFDNISEIHIKNIFLNFFNMNNNIAEILTKIVCHNGCLAQGALTSSYLASLLFFQTEPLIAYRLEAKGITYTRLIDDITLSTKRIGYEFKSEISAIKNMLTNYDLNLNESKILIEHFSTKPMSVHGLKVDHNSPRYDKEEIRRIRTLVNNIQIQSKISTYRNNYFYRKDYFRCMGTINKLSRVNHYYHKKFLKKILKISPLPCQKDIKNLDVLIKKLEDTPNNQRKLFHFIKRKNIAINRIHLINKIYMHEAKKFQGRLNAL